MKNTNPITLLLVLLGVVPLVVGGAALSSFLLLRAGYGYVVGGLLPFLASLLLVGVLGATLGRAASGRRRRGNASEGETRHGEGDDV